MKIANFKLAQIKLLIGIVCAFSITLWAFTSWTVLESVAATAYLLIVGAIMVSLILSGLYVMSPKLFDRGER